jgi:uncharacterized protein (TIGR02594 family)
MNTYPWFEIARQKLGEHEIPGSGANQFIVECLQTTSLDRRDSLSDETPWCSAFINWCMIEAGYEGTGSAWARSWLDWGREPEDAEFGQGVIVILERGANYGHVGFLADWDDDRVKLLGGNQSDSVSEAWFPQSRVLGWRVPV